MKINAIYCFAALAMCQLAVAQTVDAPKVKKGDSWIYRDTVEKGTNGWTQTRDELVVTRSTLSSIYYTIKQSGSNQPVRELIAGSDWSRLRNLDGVETVVNKPLAFPLGLGKTWDLQYKEMHPNKARKFEEWANKFQVIGYESVDVPAGKFDALKIESEGRWNAEIEPSQTVVQGAQTSQNNVTMETRVQKTEARPVSGRTYKAFWYAPEVKRWVKSVEEYYGSDGARSERFTSELESFKPAE